MAPIPLALGTSTNLGKFGEATRRLRNVYAQPLGDDAKSEYAIYASPGLKPWVTLPTGPYRGHWRTDATLYVVSGRVLYAVSLQGDVTEIAGIPGDGFVAFDANANADPDIALIANDGKIRYLNSTGLEVYDTDFMPPVIDVCFIRGRFVFGCADGRFYYSGINKRTIDALSFYNAEGKPDGLVGCWQRRNEVWLLGTETVELWAPTEDNDDPFSPLGGGQLPIGCISNAAVAENNDDIFWVDNNNQVRRANGHTPKEISPAWVSRYIEKEADKSKLVAHCYSLDSQNWYELSGTNFTVRYNLETSQWTERNTLGMDRWRGQGATYFGGRNIVGDSETGQLWELDADHPFDGDDKVMCSVVSPIVHANPTPLSVYSFHLDIITNALHGSNPEYDDPYIALRVSVDGGKKFGNPLKVKLAKQGNRGRVTWRKLGTYERDGAAFEVSYWAGVGKSVLSAIINGQPGTT